MFDDVLGSAKFYKPYSTSKIKSNVVAKPPGKLTVRGFITFIHIDLGGKSLSHGLDFVPAAPKDNALNEEAKDWILILTIPQKIFHHFIK